MNITIKNQSVEERINYLIENGVKVIFKDYELPKGGFQTTLISNSINIHDVQPQPSYKPSQVIIYEFDTIESRDKRINDTIEKLQTYINRQKERLKYLELKEKYGVTATS